jgi:hypothetical protein
LRSARGDSEPLEESVPLVDDVPFVVLSLALEDPLLEEPFVADEPLAPLTPLTPLFDEFIDELDEEPLAPVFDEFIDDEPLAPVFDEFIDDVPLVEEFWPPIEPVALELLPEVPPELVPCANAAPPAMPIAPMATAVSFKIAFIIHLLGVG